MDPNTGTIQVYTGRAQFLRANAHFAQALIRASSHCEIHAWEDIYDAEGTKLWARGKPVDAHLLERLTHRTLRKPIEMCVHANNPVATAAIAESIEAQIAQYPDFAAAVTPQAARLLRIVRNLVPNPTELLLIQVLRYSEVDRLAHAARVLALTLSQFDTSAGEYEWVHAAAHAALLHDIGEMYLPGVTGAADVRNARLHPLISAQVALELAHCPTQVGRQIELSHERLDGSGYPHGLRGKRVPAYAHALLFAETIADVMIEANGAKRASVGARLRPGALPTEMVDRLTTLAHAQAPVPLTREQVSDVGSRLREIHAQFGRVLVLVKLPFLESEAVRAASEQWLNYIEPLLWALRASGVEDALAMGITLEPGDDRERVELAALLEQLTWHRDELRVRVHQFADDQTQAGPSRLVVELMDILSPSAASMAGIH